PASNPQMTHGVCGPAATPVSRAPQGGEDRCCNAPAFHMIRPDAWGVETTSIRRFDYRPAPLPESDMARVLIIDDDVTLRQALTLGADRFIPKPFESATLVALVEMLLGEQGASSTP